MRATAERKKPRHPVPAWKRLIRGKPSRVSDVSANDEFGLDRAFFDAYLEPLLDFLFTKWFRVEVSGLENVPDTGRALIVANHSGAIPFDAPMILQALRKHHPAHRHVRYLVLKWLCSTPFAAELIPKLGFVLACRENARKLLEADHLVGVFPEGDKGTAKLYKDRYRMVRFGRGGFAEIAMETHATLIPTAVVGGEETYPVLAHVPPLARLLGLPYFPITPTFPWLGLLGALPLPTKYHIHFARPIHLKPSAVSKAADYTTVRALSELVRSRIQRELQRLVARRTGVFWD
ncbi:MAG: acyltransferase family protein [Candidatus Wallbacteria bacterium]|nr:acyltransferase family protein [Candidatus Wallbacteria bacterium]